jgi:hypothetical protein
LKPHLPPSPLFAVLGFFLLPAKMFMSLMMFFMVIALGFIAMFGMTFCILGCFTIMLDVGKLKQLLGQSCKMAFYTVGLVFMFLTLAVVGRKMLLVSEIK